MEEMMGAFSLLTAQVTGVGPAEDVIAQIKGSIRASFVNPSKKRIIIL